LVAVKALSDQLNTGVTQIMTAVTDAETNLEAAAARNEQLEETAIELLLTAIDPCQNERRGQKLESAAQREEFIGAMLNMATARCIERRHAQATTVAALKVGE